MEIIETIFGKKSVLTNDCRTLLSVLNSSFIKLQVFNLGWDSKVLSKSSAIVLVVIVVAATVLGYFYFSRIQQDNLIEISKQSQEVQSYLNQHPNATYNIGKSYLTADGMAYTVYDNWQLKELSGSLGSSPKDGSNHYCWVVHWYDPTSIIEHIVNVFIDRDNLQIVLVEEAQ